MDWLGVGKEIIAKGAPLLGTVIAGPAGGVVGGLVASLFGANVDDPKEVLQKMTADPEAAVKLATLEAEQSTKLAELKIQEAQNYLADIQSARSREVEIVKSTGARDWNLYVMAWIVVVGFVALCAFLFLVGRDIQPNAERIAYMVTGGLIAGFQSVLSYFFGSSKGSSDKNEAIFAAMSVKKKEGE